MLKRFARAGRDRELSNLAAKHRRREYAKFIPDADSDFACMARNFAEMLRRDPLRYHMSEEDARAIALAVEAYRKALAVNTHRYTRSLKTVYEKDEARKRAEQLIREAGNFIRANRKIAELDKKLIGASARPARLKRRGVPETAPKLGFAGPAPFSSTVDGKHVLKFREPVSSTSKAKPPGAVRIELYVDLVPPGEPIPSWPGARWGGRTWYLRSFTRSPMTVEYPKCNEPMRVVYWARWADATGSTGPWSATLAARVEGYDAALKAPRQFGQREQTIIITSGVKQLPDLVERGQVDVRGFLPDGAEDAETALREQSPLDDAA